VSLLRRSPVLDTGIFALFEASGSNAQRACVLLRDMLQDFPERSDLARDILKCEQDGDRITHDIIHRLSGNGHRPEPHRFGAGDLYSLAKRLDDIVDYAEQAADTLVIYGIEAPMEQAEGLAEVLVQASTAVNAALGALRSEGELQGLLVEIHQLENEGDRLSRDAIAALFANGIDPMVVIRWKDIFELLEEAIDSCESVAHTLEGISLESR